MELGNVKFEVGNVVVTPAASAALADNGQTPDDLLARHRNGDWGDVPAEDKQENEFSITHGFRIISAYTTSAGDKIWIITEADRSYTTILLPSEY